MSIGRIVHLAAAVSLTIGCGTGEALAPRPSGALPICLRAETWDIKEFRLDL